MASVETSRATGAIEWRAVPGDRIRWAELEGDYVAYHRPSGKTHLLNAASAALLREILVSPRNADAAAEALAARESSSSDAAFAAHVAGLIERLEELGLVERA